MTLAIQLFGRVCLLPHKQREQQFGPKAQPLSRESSNETQFSEWCASRNLQLVGEVESAIIDQKMTSVPQSSNNNVSSNKGSSKGSSKSYKMKEHPNSNNSSQVASKNKKGSTPQVSPKHSQTSSQQANSPSRPRTCCFCWCCCCSCSCLNMKTQNEDASKQQNSSQNRSDPILGDEKIAYEDAKSWSESFDRLMQSIIGQRVLREFLRSEYSEENILFWLACEELKREKSADQVEEKARLIYEDYISILSPKEVSLDSRVREMINRNMMEPTQHTFDEAQLQIYTLMHRDSYPRFLNSQLYKKVIQQSLQAS